MQVKRIVMGGLAATAVMIVGEIGIEPLMGQTTARFFSRLGLPLPGESAMIALVLTAIALGLISVCLYSAFAEQFGAGIKTAAQVGVIIWSLSCLLPNILLFAYGIADAQFFWFASAWPLVETVAAIVVGGLVHDGRRSRRAVLSA